MKKKKANYKSVTRTHIDRSDLLNFREGLTAAFVETETSMAAWQQQKQAVRLEAAISQWAQLTDLPKTPAWINSHSSKSFQTMYNTLVRPY